MARRMRRGKNNGAGAGILLIICFSLIGGLINLVLQYWYIILGIIMIGVIIYANYKNRQEKLREKRRQELLRYNSTEQQKTIQHMISYINQILKMQKYKLNANEKQTKSKLTQKYNELFHEFPPGFVYIVQEKGSGQVKIGKGNNPLERITKGFGVKVPYILEVLHLIPTTSDLEAEKWLHYYFQEKRTNGEWFQLTNEDIAWLKSGDYSLELLEIINKQKTLNS